MESKKNSILISIAGIAVLVGAIGSYIYYDLKERGRDEEISTNTVATTTPNSTSTTPGYTTQEVPVEKPTTKVPNINRPIVFKVELSSEARNIITNRINELTNNLKRNPSEFGDWLELGLQWRIIGDYIGAKESWEYAAVLAGESYVPWNNLGDLYAYYLKDYPKAEENFKKAIALKPDYIGGYRSLYELYRYSYKEKSNLAPQILKDGLSKNPKSTDLMILLAQYYKETGNKDTARTYYQKALTEAKVQGNTSLAALIEQEIASL